MASVEQGWFTPAEDLGPQLAAQTDKGVQSSAGCLYESLNATPVLGNISLEPESIWQGDRSVTEQSCSGFTES